MAKGNKLSANPADAHRKALRQKELKKNKAARKTNRDSAAAKKDTFELEDTIRKLTELEDSGKISPEDTTKLKDARFELARIKKIKEAYVKDHPDERHLVYRSTPRGPRNDAGDDAPRDARGKKMKTRRIFDERTGLPRHPERSLYYHPVMNPYGVPPPGMPYAERPLLPGEVDSEAEDESEEEEEDDEDDDDIPMPPDEEGLDDIPMPEGPPPGAPTEDQVEDDDFVPPLPDSPPPLPPGPPPAAIALSAPPLPPGPPPSAGFGAPGGPPNFAQGFIPPPPPGGPPVVAAPGYVPPPPGGPPGFAAGFVPPPPPVFAPGFVPPPPPGGPPVFAQRFVPPPPPGHGPGFVPPPPPGFPPGFVPPPASYAPPLPYAPRPPPPLPHKFTPPPSAHLPRRPDAPPATISAEPELRDFKKEATAFVPAALRKGKRKVASTGGVDAAPAVGAGAGGEGEGGEGDAEGGNGARPPDLVGAVRKKVKME
ncbi:hypothetical protein EXIGLDRAFT_833209, partial [Exidia glandulosa HHB12029]